MKWKMHGSVSLHMTRKCPSWWDLELWFGYARFYSWYCSAGWATSLLCLHFPVHWMRLWYFSKNIVDLQQVVISRISKFTIPPNPKGSSQRIGRKEQKRKINFSRISKQTMYSFFCRQIKAFCFGISFWLVLTLLFCTVKWMQSSCVFLYLSWSQKKSELTLYIKWSFLYTISYKNTITLRKSNNIQYPGPNIYANCVCVYFYKENIVSAFTSCSKFTVLYVLDVIK